MSKRVAILPKLISFDYKIDEDIEFNLIHLPCLHQSNLREGVNLPSRYLRDTWVSYLELDICSADVPTTIVRIPYIAMI